MIKKVVAGLAMVLAGFVGAADGGMLVTFSSQGPDRYPDGTAVVDGEYYALAWAEDTAKLVMGTDGTVAEGRVLARVAVAEGGRCPPVNVKLDAETASACQDGVWGVFLLDTRGSTGDAPTISSATLIVRATVEIASNGFLSHARLRSGLNLAELGQEVSDGFYQSGEYYSDSTDFYITSLEGLKYFRDLVNGAEVASTNYVSRFGAPSERYETAEAVRSWHTGGPFTGKIVHLMTDIDLGNEEWEPIGHTRTELNLTISGVTKEITKLYFCGKFDGGVYNSNNELTGTYKISNLKVTYTGTPKKNNSTWAYFCGLFGWWNPMNTSDYFFKNLTIENVNIQGYNYCGAFFGGAVTTGDYTVDNLHLIGTININGRFSFIGGIAGDVRGNISNCTVDADGTGTIHGYYNVGGVAGYIGTTEQSGTTVSGSSVQDVAVSAYYDYNVGAIAGFANDVVISNNTVSAVAVSATAIEDGQMGILVGASSATGDNFLVVADNTVVGSTASANGTPVTTQVGSATTEHAIVGSNVTFDESGKVTGGIFENIPAAAIADGYLATDNPDSETSANYPLAIGGPYVAKIGNTPYSTLADAVAAVPENGTEATTITMTANTELDASVQIPVNKKVVLDLNGKTITTAYNGDPSGGRHYYAIDNYGTFTLEDSCNPSTGAIIARGIESFAGGTMTMNGGTITACDANGGSPLWIEGGYVELNGGALLSSAGSKYAAHIENATVVVNDITVSGSNWNGVFYTIGSNLTVKDADIDVTCAYYLFYVDSGSTAVVNGGNYKKTGTNWESMICVGTEPSATVETNTLTINNGTFEIAPPADKQGVNPLILQWVDGGYARIVINGGTIIGTSQNLYKLHSGLQNSPEYAEVYITAGTFYTGKGVTAEVPSGTSATIAPGSVLSDKLTDGDGKTYYTVTAPMVAQIGDDTYRSLDEAMSAASGDEIAVTIIADTTENVSLAEGKTLEVTIADGVNATINVTPAAGSFLVTTSGANGITTYEAKKITEVVDAPTAAEVVVKEVPSAGVTNVLDEIAESVAKLTGNAALERVDNTGILDVVDEISVKPTEIVQVVKSAATTIQSATFDVTVTKNGQPVTNPSAPVRFRLPVDSAATQLAAMTYHAGAFIGTAPVTSETVSGMVYKFIELEADEFSPYGYTLLDGETENPVAIIGTTGYASLAAAVAAAQSGDTIELVADDRVSLTSGGEIEINKSLTITGAVDANGEPLYTIYGTQNQTGYNDIFITGTGISVEISNVNIRQFGNHKTSSDSEHAVIYISQQGCDETTEVTLSNVKISEFNRRAVALYKSTFEIDGCYIDCAAEDGYASFKKGIEILGDASGTISDTTIVNMTSGSSTVSTTAGIEFYGNGDVLVSGCTIDGLTTGIATAGFTDTTTTGTVTVENCTINAGYAAIYGTTLASTYGTNETTVYVESGTYSSDNYAVSADNGSVEISGGAFTGMLDVGGEGNGSIAISGGTFDDEIPEEYCADGYIPAVYDEDLGLYTVKTGSYVAAVYDDSYDLMGKYETLAEAIYEAHDNDTVTLLTNVTESVAIGKSMTFNGGGYTLTGTVAINGGAAVSITNAVFDAAGGNLYAFDIKGGADVAMTDVTIGGGIWCNVHLNGGNLSGAGITMVGDVITVSADGSSYTYRGQTLTGTPPFGMDFANVKGESVTIPFMDIVRETGSETVTLAEPLVRGASLLFVANMPGDDTQTGVTLPTPRFGCYTLDINAPISFLNGETTGWTETTWNEIIDTGALVLEAVGEDSDTVPVEITLNEDIDLGTNEFEFRNGNLTVDGDGNALSGTIKYTDDAGLIENLVMGTEDKPLILDVTGVTQPIEFGDSIAVTNVTIKLTEDQATAGTPIVKWDAEGGVDAPENEAGVSVAIVDAQGTPTGDTAELIWDDELGLAYIGPCEARLTGPTHEKPIYTSLADAIYRAEQSGDTVTLLTNVTASVAIGKSMTFNGGGYTLTGTVAINGGAAVSITNAVFDAAGGNLYAFDIKGGADVAMTDVTIGGGIWCNVHLNGGNLSGAGITMVGDVITVSADGSSYTYRGQTLTGTPPFGMDFANVKGESVTIPFMDIVRETGSETVTLAEPLVRGASLLFVANMPGDDTQTGVTLPTPRFGCYTLDINAPISFLNGETTGWTETTWNEIIDTGALVLEAIGEDSDTVAVELTLNEDIDLGANEFEFRNGNLTVDGDGNALSGTIKYTDDAGLIENIVMGTENNPLVLDVTGVTQPIEIGSGITVSNVTVKMTAEQATAGTPVIIWDAEGGVDAPENEAGVTVTIVDAQGDPTGGTAELIWDDELGMAYIGPCEARLTGPTHDKPIYTTLADAIYRAAESGDTVTLLTNVTSNAAIGKSLTFNGGGYKLTGTVTINNGASVAITNAVFDAAGSNLYAFDIKGGANVAMTDVTVGGGIWCNVHLNGGNLSGSNITMLGDVIEVSADGTSYTYRGQTLTGEPPFGMDFANVKGEHVTIPFMDIVREHGTETVNLSENLVRGASLLFVANMPGDDTQTGVTLPTPRFGCYTLDIDAPIDFLNGETTGWTETTWNEIIDTGALVLDALGKDSDQVPVELTLNEDIDLGANEFEFRNGNLTIDGDGNALSGTIKYTDDAGLVENIVMGTEDKPLVLDVTGVTQPIEFGDGIVVSNVTIKLTEDQAQIGTPIIIWDVDSGVGEPENPEGVSVAVVNNQGTPTGDTAMLIWDEELGLAYIGPCDARLTGPTHDTPVYTTLSNAIERAAASGDKVTLMTNVTLSACQTIDKSIEFSLNGQALAASGDAISVASGAAVQMFSEGTVTGNIAVVSGTLTITNGIYVGGLSKADGDGAKFVISGGYFRDPVLQEYCADGYSPVKTTASEYAATPYTVARVEIVYPTGKTDGGLDTVGVPIPLAWINSNTDLVGEDGLVLEELDQIVTDLGDTGANGVPLWQSYVLGLDPNSATSQLRLEGLPATTDEKVTIRGLNINVPAILESQGTTVGFHLEEAAPGSDSWTVRSDACTMAEGLPTFTVPLSTVDGKVLRIVADIKTRSK